MTHKYQLENQAQNLRNWIRSVDLTDANILGVERSVLSLLAKSIGGTRWNAQPIAPFAEPTDMDVLVGDMLFEAQQELQLHTFRLDNLYSALADVNNTLLAEIEAAERAATQASDDLQSLTSLTVDESEQYIWVGDSFNTLLQVNANQTSALVDTDYGQVTLAPSSYEVIQDFSIVIDRTQTKGIPGCNMLVLDMQSGGSSTTEPHPTLEKEGAGLDLSGLYDQDPSTWFEIERNFIPPNQRMSQRGRSYVFDATGKLEDVREVSSGLDWIVGVHWPSETTVDENIPLAEFTDIAGLDAAKVNDSQARLVFDIVLGTPQPLSQLKLLPFLRPDNPNANIDTIEAVVEGQSIIIARGVDFSTTQTSTTRLQKEILRRTGTQSTGALFNIPTDRNVEKVRISLSANPQLASKGLAHAYQEQLVQTKTTRKFLGISSVSRKKKWNRISVTEAPQTLEVKESKPNLLGSTAPLFQGLWALGGGLQGLDAPGRGLDPFKPPSAPGAAGAILSATNLIAAGSANPISQLATAIGAKGPLGGLGKSLGSAGAFLGKALPVVGGVLLASELASSLFGTKRKKTLLKVVDGYDIFRGYRAAVGIRDITLQRLTYTGQAEVVSTKLSFQSPVNKVGLFVEEDIPSSWGADSWISYYISTDGSNWISIPKLGDVTLEQSFTPDSPITDVYFRAVLRGNPDDPYRSPILKNYAFQGAPVR